MKDRLSGVTKAGEAVTCEFTRCVVGLLCGVGVVDSGSGGSNCGWLDQVRFTPGALPIPPGIVEQPRSQSVGEGDDVLFTVGVQGTLPFAYQWQCQNASLQGATNSFLALAEVTGPDAGHYSVAVSNLSGGAVSDPASLTVGPTVAAWEWARCPDDDAWCDAYAVATDGEENIYVSGSFRSTMRLGPLTVTNESGRWAFFLVKFDAAGRPLWARHGAENNWDDSLGFGLAVDPDGRVIVGGELHENRGIFLAKFDQAGNLVWARQHAAAPLAGLGAAHVALGGDGAIFLLGRFHNSTLVGTNLLISHGDADAFLAKYDRDGEPLWALPVGGPGFDAANGLAVDGAGCAHIACYSGQWTELGTNRFEECPFAAKFDSQGELVWATRLETNCYSISDLALDPAGNVFLAGRFSRTLAIGADILVGTQPYTMFLAKLDSSGQAIWARHGGGSRYGRDSEVATDAHGNAYVWGSFDRVTTFDNHALIAPRHDAFFVAKYDPEGRAIWAKKACGWAQDMGKTLAASPGGQVYKTGYFGTDARFGTTLLQTSSGLTFYLAKLSEPESLRFDTTPDSLRVTNGMFHLRLLGLHGRTPMVLERSTDLLNWDPIHTNTQPVDWFEWSDPIDSNRPACFYRAVLP